METQPISFPIQRTNSFSFDALNKVEQKRKKKRINNERQSRNKKTNKNEIDQIKEEEERANSVRWNLLFLCLFFPKRVTKLLVQFFCSFISFL